MHITAHQHFERIVRISRQRPARIARACDRVGALAERTGSSAVLMLSNALNEHRHALQQSWLDNFDAAREHMEERERCLGYAQRAAEGASA